MMNLKNILIFSTCLAFIFGCSKDDEDNPDMENPMSEWALNCQSEISSNCNVIEGSWIFMNSNNIPVLDYHNTINFNTNGGIDWNFLGYHKGKYQLKENCTILEIRSTENEIIEDIQVIELTDTTLILSNQKLCGDSPCLFLRNDNGSTDFSSSLQNKICNLQKCTEDCGDNASGYECSTNFYFVDRPGTTNFKGSIKNSENQLVFLTSSALILTDNELNVQWEYANIDQSISSQAFSHLQLLALDRDDNIYMPYIKSGTFGRDLYLLALDKNGGLIYDKLLVDDLIPQGISGGSINDFSIKQDNDHLFIYHSVVDRVLKANLDGDLIENKHFDFPAFMNPKFEILDGGLVLVNSRFKNTIYLIDSDLNTLNERAISVNSDITDLDFTWVETSYIYIRGSEIIIGGDFSNNSDSKHFGSHRIAVVIRGNQIIDFVESSSFRNVYDGILNLGVAGVLSVSRQDQDFYISHSKKSGNGFVKEFRYLIDINNSDLYSFFTPTYAYQIENRIIVLGTGVRFTNTILGYTINLDKIYPSLNCE